MMTPQDKDIQRFRLIVGERLGLQVDDTGTEHLAEVLCRRLRKRDDSGFDAYLERIGGELPDREELRAIAGELAIGETFFLRYPAQFEALAQVVLPELLGGRESGRPLRILSAGCASGEEPYSLAIVLRNCLGEAADREASILGIDFSPPLLQRAAQARYSAWSLRGLSPEQRERWFRKDRGVFVLNESIRGSVTFEERNLIDEDAEFWRPGSFDLVFFRNVSIYFSSGTTARVVACIARSLRPGGYLFLGSTETLRGLSHRFHLRHTHGAFYYQRSRPTEQRATTSRLASRAPVKAAELAATVATVDSRSWVEAIGQSSKRIAALSERHGKRAPVAPDLAKAAGWQEAKGRGLLRRGELSRAWDLLSQERFEEALKVLKALPVDAAVDPDVLLMRAVLLTNSGQTVEAEAVCRELLAGDELDAAAHYVTALCREHAGDTAGAVEHGQTAVYLDPNFAMARFHLGLMARRSGDLATARRELKEALGLLEREIGSRILLFGGGFGREALVRLCRSELRACGGKA